MNNVTVEIDGEQVPVLSVDVIPNDDQDPDLLEFKWNVTSFTSQQITLQLNFTNALYVSRGSEADQIRVTFNDRDLFISADY